MSFVNSFSSKAILLKKLEYGESDTIVTFFTEEKGKLRAFARRAKMSKKRFGTSLDLFAFVNAHFSCHREDHSLYTLNSTTTVQMFENIRRSLKEITAASYMLELFYEMTAENVKNRNLFYFLYSFLNDLNNNEVKLSHLPLWGLKFLRLIGLGPNFLECVLCGKLQDKRLWFFRCDKGGIVCPGCLSQKRPMDISLSNETLNIVRKEQEMAENFIRRVLPSPRSCRELSTLVNQFIQFHLGKDMNSYKFLGELDEESRIRV